MDKRLVFFLLKRPNSWWACARLCAAVLRKSQRATVWRNGIYVHTRVGNGEGMFCAVAGLAYEPEMKWFLAKLKPDSVFLDVGANIGLYSLHAARRIGSRGRVIAFEPTPHTYDLFIENIKLNRREEIIEPHRFGLSDHTGDLPLVTGGRPASNRLGEEGQDSDGNVAVKALDEISNSLNLERLDFLKVDIEGGEAKMFAGAKDTLRKFRPLILLESHHTAPDFPERSGLIEMGYSLFWLNAKKLEPLSTGQTTISGNIIACPQTPA